MGTTAGKFRISHSLAGHHKPWHHGHHFAFWAYPRIDSGKEEVLENPVFSRTLWRRRWDSNPRALADNLISSQARCDHFDTSPCENMQFFMNGSHDFGSNSLRPLRYRSMRLRPTKREAVLLWHIFGKVSRETFQLSRLGKIVD